jgi:cation-transporting ATPase 13A3/4/5
VRRQPLWTNWGLSLALVLQVAFILYSLFSVDAFTLRIELVGRDPPQGLPTAYRATLLGIFAVNAAAAGAALLLSVLVMQLLAKVRAQPWWQRKLEEQGASVEALLAHSSTGPSAAAAGRVTPTSVQLAATSRAAAAAGASAVHIPKLQTPSGAALL